MSESESDNLSVIRPSDDLRKISKFKLIMLGNSFVGKTSLVVRYVDGVFQNEYQVSIAVDRKVKRVTVDSENIVELQIWDTCGSEKFKTVTNQYYNLADGAILMFDLVNKSSFLAVQEWLSDFNKKTMPGKTVFLVGNKKDLSDQRQVEFEDALNFASENDLEYFEISAKTDDNVDALFEGISRRMLQSLRMKDSYSKQSESGTNTVSISVMSKQSSIVKEESKGCCY